MEIEYRLNGTIENDEIFKNSQIQTISIGSEGCMYQLPSAETVVKVKKKAAENNKKFSFVLPKLPQKHLKNAVKRIKRLNEDGRDYTLVSNDYGLLFQLKQEEMLPNQVCIGRSVSRSFEDCLWYEHILRNEDDFNRKTMIQNNMYDEDKKSFLEKFHVTGVECNMLKNQKDSYENLQNLGYEVNVHYKYISVAFSRACQTAKYYKTKAENCSHLCKKPISIAMNKIWTRDVDMESREQKMNEKIVQLNPEFLLCGNVIYRESRDSLSDISFANIDNLIFDSSFVSLNDIGYVLSKLS